MNPPSPSVIPAQGPLTVARPGALPVLAPEDIPNVEDLVTEDDTPVDNIPSGIQQRLLVEPLYSSWTGHGRMFLAAANVGLFYRVDHPPLVPDVFLSLDVQVADDWWAKSNRSYFFWIFGKPPEVVMEIVSNRKGGEADLKLGEYARIGVSYYVIYDPDKLLGEGVLRVFARQGQAYVAADPGVLSALGLGLVLWQGTFENKEAVWLRWCDSQGQLIPTGAERADLEHQRAERLAAQLRALGVEPTT